MEQNDDTPNYMSDGQQIAVLAVMALGAFLSVLGSGSIIYIIVRGERWKGGMYQRLILGLSTADLIHGIDILIQPYMAPPDPLLLGAVGTTETCSFAGFFLYTIIATCFYNFFLSFYYFKTVRHGEKEEILTSRYERWMHLSAIVTPLIVGILGLSLKAFNPAEFRRLCDIAFYPTNCRQDETLDCTRGLYTEELTYSFLALVILPGVLGIIMTSMVYWKVRQTLTKSLSHRFQSDTSGDASERRLQTVGTQAVLYCLSFVNSFLWSATSWIAEAVIPGETRASMGEPGWFALNLIGSFFFPLQGFLNFFIYVRPRYNRWREAHPQKSRHWALSQVLSARLAPTTRPSPAPNTRSESSAVATVRQKIATQSAPFAFSPSPEKGTGKSASSVENSANENIDADY